MGRTAVRAYRIRRPAPLPLSEKKLSTIRPPLCLVLGKRSLLVHPQRQVERVPPLIPGARAEIISGTGHGPQIDHAALTAAYSRSREGRDTGIEVQAKAITRVVRGLPRMATWGNVIAPAPLAELSQPVICERARRGAGHRPSTHPDRDLGLEGARVTP